MNEDKNYINELNIKGATFLEIQNKALVDINKKQSFIIKISNSLIIFMSLFIILLLYLYLSEKNKNKKSRDTLPAYGGKRRRLEILD